MSLFEYQDYRSYLREKIRSLPRKGRGELSKISSFLKINTTWMSQIMSGSQNLNHEQAYSLCRYLGHTELETDYFLLLVQIDRSGTVELTHHLKKKLEAIKIESLKISKRVNFEKKLSDLQRSVFYSSWIYSAVHIFTSINGDGATLEEIASRFSMDKSKANDIVQFLFSSGIITEKSGRYLPGVQSTFVEQGSPHLLKHHSSWRLKAIQKSENLSHTDMMVTGQYSISKKDFLKLREDLAEIVKSINNTIKETDPEGIVCLNLDWFYL